MLGWERVLGAWDVCLARRPSKQVVPVRQGLSRVCQGPRAAPAGRGRGEGGGAGRGQVARPGGGGRWRPGRLAAATRGGKQPGGGGTTAAVRSRSGGAARKPGFAVWGSAHAAKADERVTGRRLRLLRRQQGCCTQQQQHGVLREGGRGLRGGCDAYCSGGRWRSI